MSDMFPSAMALSDPIQVGSEFLRPVQWAARLAPAGGEALIAWKSALMWLEGEVFADKAELTAKVNKVIAFQAAPQGGPPPVPVAIDPPEIVPEVKEAAWQVQTKKVAKPKVARQPWTAKQLGDAIVQQALVKFGDSFRFAGPSLAISEVYQHFDAKEFTYPKMIAMVRNALAALPAPHKHWPVASTAIYAAASSPGKGNNFNIKVQVKDKSKPNGYSAAAQIHVLWQ